MTEQLGLWLKELGFQYIPSNLPEFGVYYRIEQMHVNVLQVIDYQEGLYLTQDQCGHIREKVRKLFADRGLTEVHILSLVLCADSQKARDFCQDDQFCWIVDTSVYRLLIYENQTPDFYGLRGKLEEWLEALQQTGGYEKGQGGVGHLAPEFHKLPLVTAGIILANVIVYLICTFQGDLLYNKGALSAERVLEYGEYYRIVTAWFLHGSISHLFNNMLILYFFGEIVEKKLGHLRFTILYVLSGIGGSLCSLYYMLRAGEAYVSIGASGAVFGVEGALLALVVWNRGRLQTVTFGRLAFVLAYSIYIGFCSTGVDNYAHIGGVVTGFLAGLILYFTVRKAGNT